MIKKYYWAMAVMAAFVAGTIATATPVFAPPPEDDDGEGGWKAAVGELKANEILGFYQKAETELGDGGPLDLQVNCDDGDSVTGGGHAAANFNSVIRISSHQTDSDGEGWRNIWQAAGDGFGHTTTVECADYAPVHVP